MINTPSLATRSNGSNADEILRVENLKVHFPVTKGIVFQKQVASVKAVDGVSFTLKRGETLGLVGESGCGKSTTGLAVIHMLAATGGRILFEGNDITTFGKTQVKEFRRRVHDRITARILAMLDSGEFDVASLFYARFKSAISQIVTRQQLIPFAIEGAGAGAAVSGDAVYEYEPEEEQILAELLPRNLAVQVFRALLENSASEQGARMSAMDNATRNAGDMIKRLTLSYNRQRQATITKELIEIISGAEAV